MARHRISSLDGRGIGDFNELIHKKIHRSCLIALYFDPTTSIEIAVYRIDKNLSIVRLFAVSIIVLITMAASKPVADDKKIYSTTSNYDDGKAIAGGDNVDYQGISSRVNDGDDDSDDGGGDDDDDDDDDDNDGGDGDGGDGNGNHGDSGDGNGDHGDGADGVNNDDSDGDCSGSGSGADDDGKKIIVIAGITIGKK